MTIRRTFVAFLITGIVGVLGLTAAFSGNLVPQAPTKGTLKLKVEYKGAVKVDKDHRIWVWVFDSPTIDGTSVPVASNSVGENGTSVNFESLPETVYVAVAFDETGGFDGTSGPPPSGTPVQVYGDAGTPKAIKTGTDAVVQIVFDDSVRMP